MKHLNLRGGNASGTPRYGAADHPHDDTTTLPRSAAVLAALRRGGTVPSIARETGAPEAFVATMVDHYKRVGLLAGSGSLCSSGLGACEPGDELSDVARVQCAGCPLAIR